MAVFYVKESARLGAADYSTTETQAVQEPALAEYTISIGATSLQSPKFNKETRVVELSTDAICHYKFGADPTATSNNQRLPADTIITRSITKKDAEGGFKVAVVTGS